MIEEALRERMFFAGPGHRPRLDTLTEGPSRDTALRAYSEQLALHPEMVPSFIKSVKPASHCVVNRYDLISANDVPDRDPKDWQLFGSNDGQKWSMLDTRENESFPIRFFPRSYSVCNTTAYRYYRLHVSANHGSGGGLQIAEFGLMGR